MKANSITLVTAKLSSVCLKLPAEWKITDFKADQSNLTENSNKSMTPWWSNTYRGYVVGPTN